MAKRYTRSGVARRPSAPGPPHWRPVAHSLLAASDGDPVAPCSPATVNPEVAVVTRKPGALAPALGPLPVGLVQPALYKSLPTVTGVLSLGSDPVTSEQSEVRRSGPKGGSEGDAVVSMAGTSSELQLGCSLGQAKKDPLGDIDGKSAQGQMGAETKEGGVLSEVNDMTTAFAVDPEPAMQDAEVALDDKAEQVSPQGSLGSLGKGLAATLEVSQAPPSSESIGSGREEAAHVQIGSKDILAAEIAPPCFKELVDALVWRVVKRALCCARTPLSEGSLDPSESAMPHDHGKIILPDKIMPEQCPEAAPAVDCSVGASGLSPDVSLEAQSGTDLSICKVPSSPPRNLWRRDFSSTGTAGRRKELCSSGLQACARERC